MSYLFLVNVGLGALLVCLAVPMFLGLVKPNGLYGLRTPKTLSSESIWYPANRFAGAALTVAGLVIATGSIALFRKAGLAASEAPWTPEVTIQLFLAALLVPLLASVGASLLYSRTL